MGLSNEERYLRVLNTITGMYTRFDPPEQRMWENLGTGSIDEGIAEVKESLAQLTGMLIQQTDTSGLYWFMGESEGSFRGLTMEFFSAQSQDIRDVRFRESTTDKDEKDLTLHQFAFRLGFAKHFNMLNLAHWWDMWCFIPSLLYGMNRYKDELFGPEFHKEANRLISRMMQLRLGLVAERHQEEQVLLLKYKLFTADKYDDGSCGPHLKALRMMSQDALEKEIRAREVAEHDRRRQYNRDETKKKHTNKFIDPVHGDGPTPVDSLVESVQMHLQELKPHCYVKRSLILRALDLFKADAEDTAAWLHAFEQKKLVHRRRYKNVKICRDCRLVVLDQRNKTGLCIACLKLEKQRKKRAATS